MDIIIFIAIALLWVYVKEKERELEQAPATPVEGGEQAVMGQRCPEGWRYGHLVLLDPVEKGWKYEGGDDVA